MDRAEQFGTLVCDYAKVKVEDVKSRCRKRDLCEARQLISYFLTLYTALTLQEIADIVGYKDHASPLRDKKLIPDYLEFDKAFNAKYTPLIEKAKKLAERLDKQEANIEDVVCKEGDICWFWFNTMDMPRIGTLMYISAKAGKKYFVAREFFGNFDNCQYAGVEKLPKVFRSRSEFVTKVFEPIPS